jgi:hypothetical protein
VPFYEPILSNPDGTVYKFRGQSVRLETEEMSVDGSGRLRGLGGATADLQRFADTFTKLFPNLEASNTVFAELRNLYDLMMVAGLFKHTGRQAWLNELSLLDVTRFATAESSTIREADPVVSTKFSSRMEQRNGQQARRTSVTAVSGGVSIKPGDVLGKSQSLEVSTKASVPGLIPGTVVTSPGVATQLQSTSRESSSRRWWDDVNAIVK